MLFAHLFDVIEESLLVDSKVGFIGFYFNRTHTWLLAVRAFVPVGYISTDDHTGLTANRECIQVNRGAHSDPNSLAILSDSSRSVLLRSLIVKKPSGIS